MSVLVMLNDILSQPDCDVSGDYLVVKRDYFDSELRKWQEKQTENQEENKYNELIMAVETKCPGETRHQTALRYIRQAENKEGNDGGKIVHSDVFKDAADLAYNSLTTLKSVIQKSKDQEEKLRKLKWVINTLTC